MALLRWLFHVPEAKCLCGVVSSSLELKLLDKFVIQQAHIYQFLVGIGKMFPNFVSYQMLGEKTVMRGAC